MKNLDHIAYAVHDLDKSIEFYKNHFGFEFESREKIESQGAEIVFLKLKNTKIELLAPLNEESKIHKFLKKNGPGIHHVCYKVDNIRKEMARLENEGLQLIDNEPRPGAHNTLICFFHPKSTEGVLTELCEYIGTQGD
ncbi:MAG: methylmalonyl-CoA epimerase [Bdellovibrionales bacterium]|nr:methylmalonyl-CoA epimerase [Bdellovibrionales bacterium]